jgi:hypothetical protein
MCAWLVMPRRRRWLWGTVRGEVGSRRRARDPSRAVSVTQVAVILLQRRFGARFFIPARFLPEKYNYRRPVMVTQPGRVEPDPHGNSRRRAHARYERRLA